MEKCEVVRSITLGTNNLRCFSRTAIEPAGLTKTVRFAGSSQFACTSGPLRLTNQRGLRFDRWSGPVFKTRGRRARHIIFSTLPLTSRLF